MSPNVTVACGNRYNATVHRFCKKRVFPDLYGVQPGRLLRKQLQTWNRSDPTTGCNPDGTLPFMPWGFFTIVNGCPNCAKFAPDTALPIGAKRPFERCPGFLYFQKRSGRG